MAPRHPPYALSLLIVKNSLVTAMEFSRCTRNQVRPTERAGLILSGEHGPVFQNSTAFVEVDVVLGEPGSGTAEAINRPGAYRK